MDIEPVLVEGTTSVLAVLKSKSRKVEKILVDKSIDGRKKLALRPLLLHAKTANTDVEYVDREYIDSVTSGKTHGGVCAYVGERRFTELSKMLEKENGFFVMIDGVEDPFNFGQALRAIYAAGADGVLLPKRNWMTAAATVARSSAGASEYIDACSEDLFTAVKAFSERGYKIVCTDCTKDAVKMTAAKLIKPLLLIIGGEKRGISANIKALADITVQIEYYRDFNASLGAAEACAVLAFETARQNGEKNG